MSNTLEKLKKMKQEYNEIVAKESRKGLEEVFKEFFESTPQITALYWNQYTPYFNDGEACVFGRHSFSYCTNPNPEFPELHDGDDEEKGWFEAYCYGEITPAVEYTKKMVLQLDKSLNELDDVFLEAFGDHSSIMATPTGFTVEGCDHE